MISPLCSQFLTFRTSRFVFILIRRLLNKFTVKHVSNKEENSAYNHHQKYSYISREWLLTLEMLHRTAIIYLFAPSNALTMTSAVHTIASHCRRFHLISLRVERIFNWDHQSCHTSEWLIFSEASRAKSNVILKAFPKLTILVHQTLNFWTSVGGSDIGHLVMRTCVMIVKIARCIAFRKRVSSDYALAVLIPITLQTSLAMALLIEVAVDSITSIHRFNPMPLVMLDPLSMITDFFIS